MDKAKEKEIKSKAKEINNLSEQFQLIHATYATQEYIKNIAINYYQQELNNLKQRILEKVHLEQDCDVEFEQKEQLEELIKNNRFSIDIGYINVRNEDIARVIKVDNFFTIYLASSLRDTIFHENGTYNYDTIHKIRKLMSHELGHLTLHTKELLTNPSTQGSLDIKDKNKEEEADFFGTELLELRRQRNEQINKDGGAQNLF